MISIRRTAPSIRPVTAALCLAALMIVDAGCRPIVSPYSHTAYLQATSLKARSLRLMDKATGPPAEAARDLSNLRDDLDAAYEYAKGRPRNTFSTRQWEALLDPTGHLLGGFLRRWESEGPLTPTFIVEAKRQISEAFDTISGLESGKLGAPPS